MNYAPMTLMTAPVARKIVLGLLLEMEFVTQSVKQKLASMTRMIVRFQFLKKLSVVKTVTQVGLEMVYVIQNVIMKSVTLIAVIVSSLMITIARSIVQISSLMMELVTNHAE